MKKIIGLGAGLFVLCATLASCGQGQQKDNTADGDARFSFVEDLPNKRIDILLDGKPYTSYRFADSLKKAVLYPLQTKGGHLVTRGWPVDPRANERTDHPHHIGLWFNYGDVNGLDFWNNSTAIAEEKKMKYGHINQSSVNALTSKGNEGVLDVTKYWLGPQGDSLLKEDTRYIFTVLADSSTSITLDVKLSALTDVAMKDNKEGLIGIRLARELEHPSDKPATFTDANGIATTVEKADNSGVTGHYISSEGLEGDAVWGTRAKWVNLNGTIGDEQVSLIILDHPQNPGYPTYWHARGYGLFAANPLGQAEFSKGKETLDFKLKKGDSTAFKYRVVIHGGSHLDNEGVKKMAEEFAGF